MPLRSLPLLFFSLALLPVTPARADLTSAELYVVVDGYARAGDAEHPYQEATFSDGPRFEDVFLDSGAIPWNLDLTVGGAEAESKGRIEYLAAASHILMTGQFEMRTAVFPEASAIADFDAVAKIDFHVDSISTLRIRGHVSASVALDEPEVVSCQWGGTILAGDDRATPLAAGVYYFDVERTLYPYPAEIGSIQCSAAAGGGTLDSNTLDYEILVEGLPEAESSAGMLAMGGALAALRRRRGR